MSEVEDDFFNSKFFRGLVLAALLSGVGGGLGSLTKDTSDRFKGADFRREIATRDATIYELRKELSQLERVYYDHQQHSAKYTQIIIQVSEELEELKEEVHAHQRQGAHNIRTP